MRYRQLGNSELRVSEIALGSWLTYGVGISDEMSRACLRQAFEEGINFIDTANVYGRGAAEEFLGSMLSAYQRKDYLLATKVFFPMSETDRGLSASQISKQLDGSLRRLNTEYIDLYQCHRYDHETPLEETMHALTEARRAGKVRYIGFSEWPADRIKAALEMAGVEKFVSSQPHYSMLGRWPEAAVIPLCRDYGIRQIVFSPLEQGVLTGKYQPGHPPPADSRASDEHMNGFIGRWLNEPVLRAVQSLQPVADRNGLSLAQLALAWVLQNDNVAAAIIGASRPQQVSENAAAAGVRLDAESMAEIDAVLEDVIER